jgi:hypothetical protein
MSADGLAELASEVLLLHLVHGASDRAQAVAARVYELDWDDGELYRALEGHASQGGEDYICNLAFCLMNGSELTAVQRAIFASALLAAGRVDVSTAAGWLRDDGLDDLAACPPEAAQLLGSAWLCYEDIHFLGRAEEAEQEFLAQAGRVLEEAKNERPHQPGETSS